MGNYRLTEEAKDNLRRIYRYGFEKHGEKEADKYYVERGELGRSPSIV